MSAHFTVTNDAAQLTEWLRHSSLHGFCGNIRIGPRRDIFYPWLLLGTIGHPGIVADREAELVVCSGASTSASASTLAQSFEL